MLVKFGKLLAVLFIVGLGAHSQRSTSTSVDPQPSPANTVQTVYSVPAPQVSSNDSADGTDDNATFSPSTDSTSDTDQSNVADPTPDATPYLSNDNYYTNSDGDSVHDPAYSSDSTVPAGASAKCSDGTYSFSEHRRGTCSRHGGVSTWL